MPFDKDSAACSACAPSERRIAARELETAVLNVEVDPRLKDADLTRVGKGLKAATAILEERLKPPGAGDMRAGQFLVPLGIEGAFSRLAVVLVLVLCGVVSVVAVLDPLEGLLLLGDARNNYNDPQAWALRLIRERVPRGSP